MALRLLNLALLLFLLCLKWDQIDNPPAETSLALVRLIPACLLPTIVNFKKDLSVHYSWNLTDLLG